MKIWSCCDGSLENKEFATRNISFFFNICSDEKKTSLLGNLPNKEPSLHSINVESWFFFLILFAWK